MTVVQTRAGAVRGVARDGVHAFKNLPYAAPPVGARRFRAPEPAPRWDGERDGSAYGAVCIQAPMSGIFGEIGTPKNPPGDDCLNLNVWTPDPGAAGLPVLVWIHGGAFVAGAGIDPVYDGSAFARAGIVVVTLNYRLGAQGFLQLAEHFPGLDEAGVVGLLDQIAALEWVQENIAAFGGDPARVTIAGESAGGMSVGSLMAMPRARGLFRAAIPQSGAGHNGISAPTASRIAGELLERVGVAAGDEAALLALDPAKLLAAQIALGEALSATRDAERFGEAANSGMVLQPVYGTDALPERPIDAIAAGAAAGIDVLVGSTTEEALVFLADLRDLFTEPLVLATADALFQGTPRDAGEVLALYRRALGGDAALAEVAAAIETDRMFRVPALRLADAHAKHHARTWVYDFAWRSTARDGVFGACHFLEVPFAFHTLDTDGARGIAGDPPPALADQVHASWVAFVKEGDPNHAGLPDWPSWDPARRPTLRFDLPSRLAHDPEPETRAVWDGIL